MPGNTFGQVFRLTTWGESHGPAVGCVVDGCPAGLEISEADIQRELDRRRVGQSRVTSARQEPDRVQILSGVFEGRSTGAPISMLVFNTDAKPGHYENIKDLYRPGHADYAWDAKYGFRDWRGGGRSSARETIGRVAGGAIAKRLLAQHGISVIAWTAQLGDLTAEVIDESEIERNIMRCPDARVAALMVERVEQARRSLDSLGGVVEVRARGVPPGLGEPVFDKLQADIGKAMFSIPAIKGVEFGEGFGVAHMTGSIHNDPFLRRAMVRLALNPTIMAAFWAGSAPVRRSCCALPPNLLPRSPARNARLIAQGIRQRSKSTGVTIRPCSRGWFRSQRQCWRWCSPITCCVSAWHGWIDGKEATGDGL